MRLWHLLVLVAVILVIVALMRPHPKAAKGLTDLTGAPVSLSAYAGKVVLLDFWATWCGPCRSALPHTQALSTSADVTAGKLVVLTINMAEPVGDVKAFIAQNHYTFPVLLDPTGATANAYHVDGIPNFVILDTTGKQVYQQAGLDEQGLSAALKKALGE